MSRTSVPPALLRSRTRPATGFTIVEMIITLTVLAITLGTVGYLCHVIMKGATITEKDLVAHGENDRAFLALVTDLQTTDTVGTDQAGKPYCDVIDYDGGTQNSIVFRRVEGFTTDSGNNLVASTWSTPIQYYVDAEKNLVRKQDNGIQVMANRVSGLKFDKDANAGTLTINVTTYAGRGDQRMEASNQVQLSPWNAQNL